MSSVGLLREARLANDAFSKMTLQLASMVSELQTLCLIGDSESQTLKSIADQIIRMEEEIAYVESKVDKELMLASEARKIALGINRQSRAASKISESADERDLEENPENFDSQRSQDCALGEISDEDDYVDNEYSDENSSAAKEFWYQLQSPDQSALENVPKYMRGRLTWEKLVSTVEIISNLLKSKYETMQLPKSKQSLAVRDTILNWKNQENVETKSYYFVEQQEIFTESTRVGMEQNVMKNALQVLRYCNVVKLVSSDGFFRYCVLKSK